MITGPESPVPKYLNRVYKAGFAVSQQAYETALVPLLDSVDRLEKMLTGKESLVGGILTEAEVRLWVTIVGFVIKSFHNITDPLVVARADPF